MQRLAMKIDTHQAVTSKRPSRSLKIEATGDYFYRKITPKIRLAGQWLERAGFKPGHRVEVRLEERGTLTLRSVETGTEALQTSKKRTETGQTTFLEAEKALDSHGKNTLNDAVFTGNYKVVAGDGIEPPTQGFSVLCSTD